VPTVERPPGDVPADGFLLAVLQAHQLERPPAGDDPFVVKAGLRRGRQRIRCSQHNSEIYVECQR
jgi:hypothetical protein